MEISWFADKRPDAWKRGDFVLVHGAELEGAGLPKHSRYQDYVIADGKLVGEFEEMYRDFEDPWEQTSNERFRSDKAVALNLIQMLKAEHGAKRVMEIGCGFGDFTARVHALGIEVIGMDISEMAIEKAKLRHPETSFIVGNITEHDKIKAAAPDIIVMAEVTWYVLNHLADFISFLKAEMPNVFLIHLLTTYASGVQKYGKEYFTDLEGIKRYFGFEYLESGQVQYQDGGRTWFLGRPKV